MRERDDSSFFGSRPLLDGRDYKKRLRLSQQFIFDGGQCVIENWMVALKMALEAYFKTDVKLSTDHRPPTTVY
ncbi:MAG TPA: hypothetical protein VNN73_02825 [Blastocatellia bacterium]|nr:hypothetical protein [Blastocatellia bacterium]